MIRAFKYQMFEFYVGLATVHYDQNKVKRICFYSVLDPSLKRDFIPSFTVKTFSRGLDTFVYEGFFEKLYLLDDDMVVEIP